MNIRLLATFVLLLLTLHPSASAQPADTVYGMKTLYLCFLQRGDAWDSPASDHNGLVRHTAYWDSLHQHGIVLLRGPVVDSSDLREIIVLEVDSLPCARDLAARDPLVVSRKLSADIRPWYAGRNVIIPNAEDTASTTYYFGLLVRGNQWTPEQTPEVRKIQEGHMANIRALADARKLILAGPFMDGSNYRGVFIFQVETIGEAFTLSQTDPAVRAGRLEILLHPWVLPKGSFRWF